MSDEAKDLATRLQKLVSDRAAAVALYESIRNNDVWQSILESEP